MKILIRHVFALALAASPAFAASHVDEVLEANRSACEGQPAEGTLRIAYSLVGQGLTGTADAIIDRRNGWFIESYEQGPESGANGFDGKRPWMRDQSGAVTPQEGGDRIALAVNEAYRNANAWWSRGHAQAGIADLGRKQIDAVDYDVIEVTPKGGKPFEAWFDANSHWLAKTVEVNGFVPITVTYRDYRRDSGVMLAHTLIIDPDSGPDGVETQTLLAVQSVPAQPAKDYAAPGWQRADTHIDGESTRVPFLLLNNHVYVDVRVNGRGPFRFIVDTGGHNILTPATVDALGLGAQGNSPGRGVGEKVVSTGYVKVDSLQIGAVTLRDQTLSVLDFGSPEVDGFKTDGMLGFELLRRFVTRFDYENQTLTLTDPKAFDGRGAGTAVKFLFYDHLPQVSGSIDGVRGRFDLDSGSRSELDLTKPFVESGHWRETHPKAVLAVTGWGVGGPGKAYVVRAKELELGGVRGENLVVGLSSQDKGSFSDPNFEGNVGGGFLKRFIVTFDYDRQIVYWQRRAGTVTDVGTFDRSGMWLNAGDKQFKVEYVSEGGPAQAAGLKVGDTIDAIDGKPASAGDLADVRRRLRDDPAGSELKLAVQSGGVRREVSLVLREQL